MPKPSVVHVAVALLVRDGSVLLGHRRADRRWYPDCWDLVGGHVEAGETPEQALRRECREEIGIDVHEARPIALTLADPAVHLHAFLVTSWSGEPANLAPEEHDALRWYHVDELPGLTLADAAYLPVLVAAVSSPPVT